MKIFLYHNKLKHEAKNIALGMREYLAARGAKVIAEDDEAESFGAIRLSEVDPASIDCVITLGGDGTMLRFMHYHAEMDAPILGVNLGSLGFMADIPVSEIYPSLHELLNRNFTVQERFMMEGRSLSEETCFAVNDISFHRAQNVSLVDIAIHVDGAYLNTFTADGVVISTASGSTAYSLAAGGPILSPELAAFIITPISPHTISNRPIVLMPKKEIQIQYMSELKPIEITADGFVTAQILPGGVFYVTVPTRKFRLIKLPHHDYFSTLRTKLGWSGKLRV